jgi:quercetin dioxygenase-like cupin family protein
MAKTAFAMRQGEGEELRVLGAGVRFLCEAARTEGGFSLMEVVLPKEQGPPPHDHPWDEAYYVLEGEVRFVIGDRTEIFRAGDFVYAPGGTVHSFKGASAAPARVLVLDAPAAAEKFFKEVAREVASPADMPKVPEIGRRHGLRFAPPA